MIANLITTILLAYSVATGSYKSESGNAFNHELVLNDKKPTQKATETNNYNYTWTLVDNIYVENQNVVQEQYINKYYLTKDNTPNTNIIEEPYLITNTNYTITQPRTATRRRGYGYCILRFTNYKNASQTITLTNTYTTPNSGTTTLSKRTYISTDSNLDNIINLTITASIKTTLDTALSNANKTTLEAYTSTEESTSGSNDYSYTTPTITLAENETLYVIISTEYELNKAVASELTAKSLNIQGSYIVIPIEQEVVDIPNLMFTVLTLPFAWYSTAFNLTIFPNTPYQINFGNIIMTVVATLILFYIIKKVVR